MDAMNSAVWQLVHRLLQTTINDSQLCVAPKESGDKKMKKTAENRKLLRCLVLIDGNRIPTQLQDLNRGKFIEMSGHSVTICSRSIIKGTWLSMAAVVPHCAITSFYLNRFNSILQTVKH